MSGNGPILFFARCVLIGATTCVLASCGAGEKKSAPPLADDAVEIQAPIALPPNYGDRPGDDVKKNMQPPMGVNVDNMFAEELRDDDARFDRLENAVLELRRDFETLKPTIMRLTEVEGDLQDLIAQIEILLAEEATAVPAEPIETVPHPVAAPAPLAPPAPPVAPTGAVVEDLRLGMHADKVRLVFDLTQSGAYSFDLDNNEKLLVLELPETGWGAAMQQAYPKNPLIESYRVEAMGQGTRVVISLKKPTSILKKALLPPGAKQNYRVFVDLSL